MHVQWGEENLSMNHVMGQNPIFFTFPAFQSPYFITFFCESFGHGKRSTILSFKKCKYTVVLHIQCVAEPTDTF